MTMTVALNSTVLTNPNINSSKTTHFFQQRLNLSLNCTLQHRFIAPKPLVGIGFPPLNQRNIFSGSIAPFSASHEDSHSELDIEKEKGDAGVGEDDPQEAWKQALDSFKEQAVKMQSISQEAYEVYSKKAMVILQETSEQLKIQADKSRNDLSILAKEITEEGVEYLSEAAERSPEPVKEVVETLTSSPDDLKDISRVRDFYYGIPYGLLLSVGGFISFMLNGSISAIRFGVILGGALLALSISSLRSYKRGQPDALALKGQAVIAGVIFLRELRLLLQRSTVMSYFNTFISGAMVAFYVYKIMLNMRASRDSSTEPGMDN